MARRTCATWNGGNDKRSRAANEREEEEEGEVAEEDAAILENLGLLRELTL
jgi:hypothetical protein